MKLRSEYCIEILYWIFDVLFLFFGQCKMIMSNISSQQIWIVRRSKCACCWFCLPFFLATEKKMLEKLAWHTSCIISWKTLENSMAEKFTLWTWTIDNLKRKWDKPKTAFAFKFWFKVHSRLSRTSNKWKSNNLYGNLNSSKIVDLRAKKKYIFVCSKKVVSISNNNFSQDSAPKQKIINNRFAHAY